MLKKDKESLRKSQQEFSPEQTGPFDKKYNTTESLGKAGLSQTNLEAPLKVLKVSKSILSNQKFVFYDNPAKDLDDDDEAEGANASNL